MTRYIAAIDIGTTAAKALLVDEHGHVAHPVSVPLHTQHGHDGSVTQQPADWFDAVARAAAAWWSAGISPASIACIAPCGQMQNLVALDAGDAVLMPALLYADRSAVDEAAAIERMIGRDALLARLGNPIDAGSIAPKLMRWRQREPATFARTAHLLLGAKDAVITRLTGAHVVDPTTASTTGLYRLFEGAWDRHLFDTLQFDAGVLPRIAPADEVVGEVTAAAAAATGFAEGTPVLCGLGDAAASAAGAALVAPGALDACLYLGTSAWISCTVPRVAGSAPAGVYRLAGIDSARMITIAPVLNGGNVLEWALGLLGHAPGDDPGPFFEQLQLIAARDDERAHQPLFLPFLTPERCPISTQGPGGAFIGIGPRTRPADLLRAVLDGSAMSLRWCSELLNLKQDGQVLPVLGGGVKCRPWLQAIADALGRPLQPLAGADHLTGLGVAAVAARALGWTPPRAMYAASAAASVNTPVLHPGPQGCARITRSYANFRAAAAAIASISSQS